MLERPGATWWILIGLLVAVVCLRLLDIPAEPVLAVAALMLTVVGLVRGSLRRLWLPALQAPATLFFGTIAFIAVAAGSQIGSTLVAVGLLAHTVWDVIHLRAKAIVAPSLAEWRMPIAIKVSKTAHHVAFILSRNDCNAVWCSAVRGLPDHRWPISMAAEGRQFRRGESVDFETKAAAQASIDALKQELSGTPIDDLAST